MNCALSENNLCFAPNHEVKETIVAGVGAVASNKSCFSFRYSAIDIGRLGSINFICFAVKEVAVMLMELTPVCWCSEEK